MEHKAFEIGLTILSAVFAGISWFFAAKAAKVEETAPMPKAPPHQKKILVPGKGIFTQPKPKRTPKYWSESELWRKEQDER